MAHEVSRTRFARCVEEALRDVPEPFAGHLEEVRVEVRDRPSPAQLRSVGLSEEDLLLGLYEGRPLTERSVTDGPVQPDVIYIFQDDLQQVSDSERQLIEEIRRTVLHEIGHFFGMDEEQLDELGYG